MKDKSSWIFALLLVSVLLVPTTLPQANAFKVIDHAMCKDIDQTFVCNQRTSEFQLIDKWAYFWLRGTFETPDVKAKLDLNFYDPDDHVFATFLWYGEPKGQNRVTVVEPGEIVVWMGIGIAEAHRAEGGTLGKLGLDEMGATSSGSWIRLPWRIDRSALEKPGEWRAEFTLDGRVVVSERFSIGEAPTTTVTTPSLTTAATPVAIGTETQPAAPGLPSNVILIAAAVVVIVVLLGALALRRRGRARSPPPSPTASPP